MLYTASFYDPDDWEGRCFRVSRAHPRGRQVHWHTLPFLYPPRDLLRTYRSGSLDFQELSRQYVSGLNQQLVDSEETQDWVNGAGAMEDFTLLCFERGDKPCHRRVLAEWLLKNVPGLKLGALR